MNENEMIPIPEGCEVTLAKPEDCVLLKECEDLCFESDPWSVGMFCDALENPCCRIYVLKDIQLPKIVAYGVMYYCLDEADLANIAVIPSERKRGFGAALLELMLKDAREMGVLRTFLEVRESNVCAKGLYFKKGFKEIGKRRRYYRDPVEDAVIMVREEE